LQDFDSIHKRVIIFGGFFFFFLPFILGHLSAFLRVFPHAALRDWTVPYTCQRWRHPDAQETPPTFFHVRRSGREHRQSCALALSSPPPPQLSQWRGITRGTRSCQNPKSKCSFFSEFAIRLKYQLTKFFDFSATSKGSS
jgi:hypothetical protein